MDITATTLPTDELHGTASSDASKGQITATGLETSGRQHETDIDDDTMPPLEEVPTKEEVPTEEVSTEEVPTEEEVKELDAPKEAKDVKEVEGLKEAEELDNHTNVFRCEVCGDKFDFEEHLITHRKLLSNDCFRCDYCGEVYDSEMPLIRHQNAKGHYYCFTCGRKFGFYESLLQHLKHSPSHNFCIKCGLDYPSPRDLQAHLQSVHRGAFCPCTLL